MAKRRNKRTTRRRNGKGKTGALALAVAALGVAGAGYLGYRYHKEKKFSLPKGAKLVETGSVSNIDWAVYEFGGDFEGTFGWAFVDGSGNLQHSDGAYGSQDSAKAAVLEAIGVPQEGAVGTSGPVDPAVAQFRPYWQ